MVAPAGVEPAIPGRTPIPDRLRLPLSPRGHKTKRPAESNLPAPYGCSLPLRGCARQRTLASPADRLPELILPATAKLQDGVHERQARTWTKM